ncbi:MAG: GHKL domain-containing protein [Bacteroidetes bacterium]|nr:GHKL domain-containing protein [Bacteroidota bacterium]
MVTDKESFAALIKKHSEEKKDLEDTIRLQHEELDQAKKHINKQNDEKEKRAAELVIANIELVIQSEEKAKRAAELAVANIELAFQSEEKAKRAAELLIANIEVAFQSDEKRKRAAELVIANVELAFQNSEKENRAAELIIANIELAFQLKEKGGRVTELNNLHNENTLQHKAKDAKAAEMEIVNRELKQFAYVASHDLQHPLRTVASYMELFESEYMKDMDEGAHKYIRTVKNVTSRMTKLIQSLLDYSHIGHNRKRTLIDCNKLIKEVLEDLQTLINKTEASIEVTNLPTLNLYDNEMRQLFQNLISNAIKFRNSETKPKINISAKQQQGEWIFSVQDNGIGIEEIYHANIFNIFERLHNHKDYEGSGIGLANCKKIIELHQGEIKVESKLGQGTRFYFNIPQ